MRDLLELKNIALLYELWFFRLVHEISAVLGRPPVRSGRLASDLFQTAFAAGGTFESVTSTLRHGPPGQPTETTPWPTPSMRTSRARSSRPS